MVTKRQLLVSAYLQGEEAGNGFDDPVAELFCYPVRKNKKCGLASPPPVRYRSASLVLCLPYLCPSLAEPVASSTASQSIIS